MTKVQTITAFIVLAGGLSISPQTNALQNAGGGWWCEASSGYFDGETYHVIGGACYYDWDSFGGGGGGGGGWPEPQYGGGGGGGAPSYSDLDISPKLECVLQNYLDVNSKLKSGQTLKKVDAWAFKEVKNGVAGYGYKIQSSSTPPSADWKPVGGISGYGAAYGRLYNAAFQSRTLNVTGERYNSTSSFNGAVSSFEMSVYVAGHEAAHLAVANATEAEADWYGVYALKRYKADNGNKCQGQ